MSLLSCNVDPGPKFLLWSRNNTNMGLSHCAGYSNSSRITTSSWLLILFLGHKYPMRWLACNVLKRCFHIWVLLNSIYSVSILINIWGRPDSTKLRKADLLQDRRLMEDLYNHSAHIFSRCCAKISEMMSLNSARTRKHKCKDCINLILQWKRN